MKQPSIRTLQRWTDDLGFFDLILQPRDGGFKIRDWLYTLSLDDKPPEGVVIVDVYDLNDGAELPERIWPKIRTAIRAFKAGQSVAIRCAAGISRSNSIAAAVLALQGNLDYTDALNEVQEKCPRAMPNMDIIDSVQETLARYAGRPRPIPFQYKELKSQ